MIVAKASSTDCLYLGSTPLSNFIGQFHRRDAETQRQKLATDGHKWTRMDNDRNVCSGSICVHLCPSLDKSPRVPGRFCVSAVNPPFQTRTSCFRYAM